MSKRIGFKTTLLPELIKSLKVEAAEKGTSVNLILEDLILQHMDKSPPITQHVCSAITAKATKPTEEFRTFFKK